MSIVAHRSGRPTQWMSIHEAASLVGVSPATLRRWSDAGSVQAFTTPGGHRRFSRRSITSMLPSGSTTPAEDQLEHVRDALLRVQRGSSRRIAMEPVWLAALDEADRAELARQGQRMVCGLVAALGERDSPGGRGRPSMREAATLSGELVARRGIELEAMVEAGLRLDAVIVHEVAVWARRLELDGPTTARWLDVAACSVDRLLADAMCGHALGRSARGTSDLITPAAGGVPP